MASRDTDIIGLSTTDARQVIHMIEVGSRDVKEHGRRGSGGKRNIIAKTPSGGIAARTGAGPWTPGVATCTLCEQYDDTGTWKIREKSPTEDVVIYNSSPHALAGSKPVQAKPIGGKYYADVAECV